MDILKIVEEAKDITYYKVILDKEIDKYNARVDEDNQIDIFQVRNTMNNYNDIEEIKQAIKQLKEA